MRIGLGWISVMRISDSVCLNVVNLTEFIFENEIVSLLIYEVMTMTKIHSWELRQKEGRGLCTHSIASGGLLLHPSKITLRTDKTFNLTGC